MPIVALSPFFLIAPLVKETSDHAEKGLSLSMI